MKTVVAREEQVALRDGGWSGELNLPLWFSTRLETIFS